MESETNSSNLVSKTTDNVGYIDLESEPTLFSPQPSTSKRKEFGEDFLSPSGSTSKKRKINNETAVEDAVLQDAAKAIQSVTTLMESASGYENKSKYRPDVEAYGEYVKSELDQIVDESLQDETKFKINNIIYEVKQKQRRMNENT